MTASKAISVQDKNDCAISVNNVSKTFKIPHEKSSSLKSAAIHLFDKKGFEIFKALDSISFKVGRGEFLGIIGRNGSGKSTLLKILAGIYVPDRNGGKVEINGKLSPFLELGVGFNPELTARENVYLGGAVLGLSRKEISKKFDKIVKFAELEDFIDVKFKNFSSGMQVRLAFALAINAHAEILLMDEVLAVGDTNFQTKCIEEFNKYKKEGKTVVLVTHDISVVQRYCDRAILMSRGKIESIGKPEVIANNYVQNNINDLNESGGDLSQENSKENKIQIKKIQIVDKTGKGRRAFMTGDTLTLTCNYVADSSVKTLNVGVAVYTSEGVYCYGTNTIIDGENIAVPEGSFRITYPKIPLKNNSYLFRIGFFGATDSKVYKFIDDAAHFVILSDGQSQGLLELNHKWG